MKTPEMDSLILLPKEIAIDKYFRGHNWKWMKRLLFAFFLYFALALCASVIWQDYIDGGLEFFGLIFATVFFVARDRIMARKDYILWIMSFVMLQFIGIAAVAHLSLVLLWSMVYLMLVHFFQMSRPWTFVLLLFTLLCLVGRWTIDPSGWLIFYGLGIQLPATVLALFTSSSWADNRRENFIETWQKLRVNREHSRMKRELDHAQEIQLSMLPAANPDLEALDVASISIPASEVGGDYYDYFLLDQTKLALVIGDVSGHGVASGLVLSGVRSCLYLLKENLPAPAALLGQLNRMLKQTTDKRMFMTMLTAVIDFEKKEMTYATAGHPLLFHFRRKEKVVEEIDQRALPLGAIMNATYPEATMRFDSGDTLLFFTDGIFEAADRDHNEYGMARLREKLKKIASKESSAELILEQLLVDIRQFIGFQEQLDDMTMVVVQVV